jgi:predicted permease
LNVEFNHRVAFFGAALALATALLFGLAPALRAARGNMAASLREAGRTQSAGRGVSMLRSVLVVAQVAISVVLVIGSGLLVRSLANAERVDAGVDADRIAVVGTNLPQAGVTPEEGAAVVDSLLERIEALPGVERAALTTRLPAEPGGTTSRIVEGYTPPSGTGYVEIALAVVSRGYFETMGIALRRGRAFGANDSARTRPVVVVNEAAARAYWQGDAVGGRVRGQTGDSQWLEVVGVVADTKVSELTEPPTPMLYVSAEQVGAGAFSLVARTSRDPAALANELGTALREVRATLPITRSMTLEAHLGGTLRIARVATFLMGAFSILALSIATLGIYAVVAFGVEQRTHELGVRIALGATATRIVRMVVRESLTTVGIGLAAGLGLAAVAMRGLEGVLYGVLPMDTVTFAGAAALLLAAGVMAAFLPARRGARTNPAAMLRRE